MAVVEVTQKTKVKRTWTGNLAEALVAMGVPNGQMNNPGRWKIIIDGPENTATGTIIIFREVDT